MNNWRKTPLGHWINFDQIKLLEVRYDTFTNQVLVIALFGKVIIDDCDDKLIISAFATKQEAVDFLDDFVFKAKADSMNVEN